MNKSKKSIILIFAVIMIMVITGLGFCKGRTQKKNTKEKKIEKVENGKKTIKYLNNEVTKDKQTGISYVKNVIDIFFDESISETKKTEIIDEVQGSIIDSIPSVNQVQIKIPETDYQGLKRSIEIIEEKEGVLAATSDIVMPIDMSSRKEFKAENPKKDYTNKEDWYQKIGAESFERYKTSHINVGVVDVGFDFNHADVDIIDLSKIRSKKKDHGTHVAGIIGAKHNNYGINGVLSNCTLYGYDCLPDENQKPYMMSQSCMLYGLIACVEKGCKVINYSVGFSEDEKNLTDIEKYEMGNNWSKYMYIMLHRAKIRQSGNKDDFIVVQAAGNGYRKNKIANIKGRDASNTGFFACISKENCYHKDDISVNDILDRILIVANAEEEKDGYILDVTSNGGEKISVSAPGDNVYSTVKGGYAMDGGTSMAAPMVAGAAAGIWSIYPEMTGADVKNAIVETAEDKVKSNPKAPNSADNNQNIYKFLNIKKALQYCEMKKIKEKEVAEMAEEKSETKGEKFTGTAEDMRAAMEKATNLKVVYITTADFDADGNNESFALATDDSKDPYWGYHTAEIWFVDSNGECQCIKKEENISRNDEVLGGRNLFFNYEKHEYQTSSVSCLYGVKNGQPYELQISGKYMNFRIDENRNKYIAEDPEYNEGQQYEDIFFEYDENIEEFYKITN